MMPFRSSSQQSSKSNYLGQGLAVGWEVVGMSLRERVVCLLWLRMDGWQWQSLKEIPLTKLFPFIPQLTRVQECLSPHYHVSTSQLQIKWNLKWWQIHNNRLRMINVFFLVKYQLRSYIGILPLSPTLKYTRKFIERGVGGRGGGGVEWEHTTMNATWIWIGCSMSHWFSLGMIKSVIRMH